MIGEGLRTWLIVLGLVTVSAAAARSGPPAWSFPCETEAAWYLGNVEAARGVSKKKTGQLVGGWHVGHKDMAAVIDDGTAGPIGSGYGKGASG